MNRSRSLLLAKKETETGARAEYRVAGVAQRGDPIIAEERAQGLFLEWPEHDGRPMESWRSISYLLGRGTEVHVKHGEKLSRLHVPKLGFVMRMNVLLPDVIRVDKQDDYSLVWRSPNNFETPEFQLLTEDWESAEPILRVLGRISLAHALPDMQAQFTAS